MDYNEASFEEIQKFRITINGDLTALELGHFIINISNMYSVIQQYLGSTHELDVVRVRKGSEIIDFLADSTVWEHMVGLWHAVSHEHTVDLLHAVSHDMENLWGKIEGNVYWDAIKLLAIRKLTKDNLTETEEINFIKETNELARIAISKGYSIEVDVRNKTYKLYREAHQVHEYISKNAEVIAEILNQEPDYNVNVNIGFPPRRVKHKKRK